jgi:hypothetical protein
MIPSTLQTASIVIYGNQYLCHQADTAIQPYIDLKHPTFAACKKIEFVDLVETKDETTEVVIAENIEDWFKWLRANDCKGLRIQYQNRKSEIISDRMGEVFINGGKHWQIEAIMDKHAEIWRGVWEVDDPSDPEQRVWRVKYIRIRKNAVPIEADYNLLGQSIRFMATSLGVISRLAQKLKLNHFVNQYNQALATLNQADPVVPEVLSAANYLSQIAKRLFLSCHEAWVFSAMASWNAIRLPDAKDQAGLDQASDSLYDSINLGICRAVNQSYYEAYAKKYKLSKINPNPMRKSLCKWNWGAFLCGFVWSYANRVPIGLLSLIPILGLPVLLVLGVKGSEWAWKNNPWQSVKQFQKVQKSWAIAGLVFWGTLLIILFGLI